MSTILVIPDSHAKPGVSNARYTWLGRLIVDRKPEIIVEMGDFYDMESLSSYDKGKKSFEGRRYTRDIDAGNDALDKLEAEIAAYNRTLRLGHKARYNPVRKRHRGNHEERILRVSELAPELDGAVGYHHFNEGQYGWEVHDYMEPDVVEGILFSHCVGSGVMNKPIGGEYPASALLKKKFMSCVVAHSHIRDFAERTAGDGRRICGIVAGCYVGAWEKYAGEANRMWWNGITILKDVKEGSFNPEFIPMERIRKLYS